MSIDGERYTHQRDILNPSHRHDWGELLGLSAPDVEDLTQLGIETLQNHEYDQEMNRALGQIDRVAKALSDEGIASFSLSSADHTVRAALIQDFLLAGPGTLTVIRNEITESIGDQVMHASMWVFDARHNCIAYRHKDIRETKDGWEPSSIPRLEPEDDNMVVVQSTLPDPPHEFMPMDNDEVPKTEGQIKTLNGLIQTLEFCDTVTHDERVTKCSLTY